MLTSAIAQHLVQVQPRGDQYTGAAPKTEADYVKLFNAIYERGVFECPLGPRSERRRASCFDGFVANAMPVRHGGCRSNLRLAAAPRRYITRLETARPYLHEFVSSRPHHIKNFLNHRLVNRAMRKEWKATHHENAYSRTRSLDRGRVSTEQSCRGTVDEVADR